MDTSVLIRLPSVEHLRYLIDLFNASKVPIGDIAGFVLPIANALNAPIASEPERQDADVESVV